MAETRIYTQEGYDALVSELDFMKSEREKNKKEISEARSFGDLSENSEYDEAKNNQAKIAHRIEELEDLVKNAVVQSEDNIDYSKVSVGSTVVVIKDGKEVTYRVVGSYEADPFAGLISDESPIGAALRGHGAGEDVTYALPNGNTKSLHIVSVARTGRE